MSTNDPMMAATEPVEYSNEFWGRLEVSARFVYSAKGERPRDFVEGEDDPKRRSTEVKMSLTTIDAQGLARPVIERTHLNWTQAWKDVVWKSLSGLGFKDLRAAANQWFKVEMVPTGRVYTNKEGKEVTETTMQFVAAYTSEAACIRAYEESAGVSHDDAADEAALSVVRVLASTAKGDMAKLAANLTAIKSPYTIDSPEVLALLTEMAVAA